MLQPLVSEYDNGGHKSSGALVEAARELVIQSLELSGRRTEAASLLERMASRKKDDGTVLNRLGNNYFQAGKYTEAKRAYRATMDCPALDTGIRSMAMYQLALCYEKTGFHNSAQRIALKVVELYSDTDAANLARAALRSWAESARQP